MLALLAALAVAAADPAGQRPAPAPERTAPGSDAEDAEIIRNLDLLEKLELLEVLELLEPRDDPPETGSSPPGR